MTQVTARELVYRVVDPKELETLATIMWRPQKYDQLSFYAAKDVLMAMVHDIVAYPLPGADPEFWCMLLHQHGSGALVWRILFHVVSQYIGLAQHNAILVIDRYYRQWIDALCNIPKAHPYVDASDADTMQHGHEINRDVKLRDNRVSAQMQRIGTGSGGSVSNEDVIRAYGSFAYLSPEALSIQLAAVKYLATCAKSVCVTHLCAVAMQRMCSDQPLYQTTERVETTTTTTNVFQAQTQDQEQHQEQERLYTRTTARMRLELERCRETGNRDNLLNACVLALWLVNEHYTLKQTIPGIDSAAPHTIQIMQQRNASHWFNTLVDLVPAMKRVQETLWHVFQITRNAHHIIHMVTLACLPVPLWNYWDITDVSSASVLAPAPAPPALAPFASYDVTYTSGPSVIRRSHYTIGMLSAVSNPVQDLYAPLLQQYEVSLSATFEVLLHWQAMDVHARGRLQQLVTHFVNNQMNQLPAATSAAIVPPKTQEMNALQIPSVSQPFSAETFYSIPDFTPTVARRYAQDLIQYGVAVFPLDQQTRQILRDQFTSIQKSLRELPECDAHARLGELPQMRALASRFRIPTVLFAQAAVQMMLYEIMTELCTILNARRQEIGASALQFFQHTIDTLETRDDAALELLGSELNRCHIPHTEVVWKDAVQRIMIHHALVDGAMDTGAGTGTGTGTTELKMVSNALALSGWINLDTEGAVSQQQFHYIPSSHNPMHQTGNTNLPLLAQSMDAQCIPLPVPPQHVVLYFNDVVHDLWRPTGTRARFGVWLGTQKPTRFDSDYQRALQTNTPFPRPNHAFAQLYDTHTIQADAHELLATFKTLSQLRPDLLTETIAAPDATSPYVWQVAALPQAVPPGVASDQHIADRMIENIHGLSHALFQRDAVLSALKRNYETYAKSQRM